MRTRLTETAADTALSFAVPYLAYIPAEKVHASGVLAAVTAAPLAHKAPRLQSASSRLSERMNWASVTFLLENAVFLLIGLQMQRIIDGVRDSEQTLGHSVLVGLAVLLACLLLRPLWVVPVATLTTRDLGPLRARLPSMLVTSWAGMRGVVTLAAALTLPDDTPYRSSRVDRARGHARALLLQGLTLPALARALDVRGPDPREDALAEATVVGAGHRGRPAGDRTHRTPTRDRSRPCVSRRPYASTGSGNGSARAPRPPASCCGGCGCR